MTTLGTYISSFLYRSCGSMLVPCVLHAPVIIIHLALLAEISLLTFFALFASYVSNTRLVLDHRINIKINLGHCLSLLSIDFQNLIIHRFIGIVHRYLNKKQY